MIIIPILNKLLHHTCEYADYLVKHLKDENELYKIMKCQEKQSKILKLRENLRHNTMDNTMSYSVLRSCAPYFQLVVEDLDKFLAEKFKKNNKNIFDSDSDTDDELIEEIVKKSIKKATDEPIEKIKDKSNKRGTIELSKKSKIKCPTKKTKKSLDVEIDESE